MLYSMMMDWSKGFLNYGGYLSVLSDMITEPTYVKPWRCTSYVNKISMLISIDHDAKTIWRSWGSWLTDGAGDGGRVILSGCLYPENDGEYIVDGAPTADTLTYASGPATRNEYGATASMFIEQTGKTVAINIGTKTLTLSTGSWPSVVGGIIELRGCTTPANDGIYHVASIDGVSLVWSDTTGGDTTEAGNGTQMLTYWYPGGKYPQVKLTAGMENNFFNCYWDAGASYVVAALEHSTSYTGAGYQYVQFSGYQGGFDSTGEWFQFICNKSSLRYCERSDDDTLKLPGINPQAHSGIWTTGGSDIWVETASGDRYKYRVISSSWDGTDGWVNVSLSICRPSGSPPPPVPIDAQVVYLCASQPIWSAFHGKWTQFQNLTVGALQVGEQSSTGVIEGDKPRGSLITQIKAGSVAYDVGTINAGATSEETLSITGVQAGSAVSVYPSTKPSVDGIIIGSVHTATDEIHMVITNTSGSNWTPGELTWIYYVVKPYIA